MYSFELKKADSVANAAALLSQTKGKPLAGGQSLVAAMKLRLAQPGTLVDLSGIAELKGIRKEGEHLVIGAMTRHAEVAASKEVQSIIPALAALAEGIGDRQVRNMGTIGGALANNDPAACYPAAVLGLNATVNTNKRKIAADDFFKGMYATALARRRDHHVGELPDSEEGGVREVRAAAVALRAGRRVRRADRQRRCGWR
jgi:carbon-monoxide dehydrogenase medium subunit